MNVMQLSRAELQQVTQDLRNNRIELAQRIDQDQELFHRLPGGHGAPDRLLIDARCDLLHHGERKCIQEPVVHGKEFNPKEGHSSCSRLSTR